MQDRFKEWFHEWYDTANGEWKLEPVYEVRTEESTMYFRRIELLREGLLTGQDGQLDIAETKNLGIEPLKIDDELAPGVKGEIFTISLTDRNSRLSKFENKWLPIPYFFKRTQKRFKFGPLNWSRFMMIPVDEDKNIRTYDILLAFDTKAYYRDEKLSEMENMSEEEKTKEEQKMLEMPVFVDKYSTSMDFDLCGDYRMLLNFCKVGEQWSFIFEHIMHLLHPGISSPAQVSARGDKKLGFIANYIFLISFLSRLKEFPSVTLYKDIDVPTRDIDMVIDIGNSSTTALLIEENRNFNQVRPLSLINFTELLTPTDEGNIINRSDEPFDMRIAFRKVDFGNFGLKDSKQFIYPSLVRLGVEANQLIHRASTDEKRLETLSTYSSPKRYLWDGKPNKEEWRFLVLPGETDEHILNLHGITSQLKSDGKFDESNSGGASFHYSRRTLMTLAFLEMLTQAQIQINSERHRSVKYGMGEPEKPRKIKRIIVTCPTAMSRVERIALIKCAKDAVKILAKFYDSKPTIEVIPSSPNDEDGVPNWYYDEATCSQLVYMFGEVGHKYKGNVSEFFQLYGKTEDGEEQPSLTVGSLDIGAGTSDLMISKYTYHKGNMTTITPEPLFYDSFYFAGDDMLHGLIKNFMLLNEESAFRKALKNDSFQEYRQKMKNFFGLDHNNQTLADRILRKDFNIQYSVPLMHFFLELTKNEEKNRTVTYDEVFRDCPPNPTVIQGFKEKTGIDITSLSWDYNSELISSIIEKEFDPILKKIATIMYAYACDVILLSGRPASLPPVRNIFLKYYPVSADRLILLNNYYVGDWYPFSNNTGYITNPKTIVAMGGVIAHYAAEIANLNKFVINLELLKKGLKSTVNYIESTRDAQPVEYFITPEKLSGDIMISVLPTYLKVRQIDIDTYPERLLYTIDFNRQKIADRIRRKLFMEGETATDARVFALVNEEIDRFKNKMPFTLTISRDPEDTEKLTIDSITDKNGNNISEGNIEINIQSLGAENQYWMDSGSFNF